MEATSAAGRAKSYLGALFHRLAARRGAKRAAVAVATRSWSSPTSYSPTSPLTAISDPTNTITETASTSLAASHDASRRSGISCPCHLSAPESSFSRHAKFGDSILAASQGWADGGASCATGDHRAG